MKRLTSTQHFLRRALGLFLFMTALMATAPSVIAQGVTPDHIAKMNAVTTSAISEDGRHTAYVLSVPADPLKENSGNDSHLYILDNATGQSKPYFTVASVREVNFRPGTGTVTFLTKLPEDKVNGIYEVPLAGGEAVKIFSFDQNISSYSWQGDGNHIVFSAKEEKDKIETPLTYTPDFYEENRPQQRAYIQDVRKNSAPERIQVEGSVYLMKWSPDRSKVAISAAPTPSVDDFYMEQQVMVVDAATKKVIAKVDNEGKLGQIEWSPDSKMLALKAAKDIHDPIDGRLLIVSAEGGKPQLIDAGYHGKYDQISWTGANSIHFLASEGTAAAIGTIQPDGTGKQYIFKSPAHAISNFSRAAGGMISFVASAPIHPSEVYTISTGRRATPQKRTDHNPWLAEVTLGKQEKITYKTRDSKFEIEGILIYPLNYTEGQRVPLITVIHGGPEAHYSNGWLTAYSIPGQMAAAKGYAVFYPNYRGSTGRGAEFAYSSQGDLAGKEFDDIVDGVDYLIDQAVADKDRIGVTGGSYGGYASAWMSTYYSDRFAAAVMFVGISNNISKWGTSDIPEELYLVHSRKRIWNHWMWSLERSPIYYVDRSETPILIMHGAEDTRVHPAQSLELYRHLVVRKPEVPVRLIFYPGEGHGNTRSGSKYDYNLRMLQWFDTYLLTGDATAEKPSLDLPVKKQ